MHFDFVSLKTFLAVADTESFRAASEQLNLSVSAVSRRITELETEFGQQFFARHSRGVEITEPGRLFAERARETFATLQRLQSDMDKLKQGDAGQITISANGSALVNGLAAHIGQFLSEHPNIDVDLFEQLTPGVLRHVERGAADIGFISKTMRIPETLQTRPYLEDKLVLVVPAEHALAKQQNVQFADLLEFQVIGVDETSSLTRLVRKVGGLANAQFAFSYMASTNEVARTMVANGLGIAILPEKFVDPYVGLLGIVAVPIDEDWAKREISIVLRTENTMSGPAHRFFNWLQNAADHPA